MFHVCVAHSFSFLNEVMISFKISLTYTSLQKSSLKMDTVFKNMNKLAIVDDENSSCSVEHHQCQTDLSLLKNKIYFKINLIMPHHKGSSDSVQRDEYYNCAKESTSPMSQSSQESFKNEDVSAKSSLSPQVTPTSRWSNQRKFRLPARKKKLNFSEMTPPSQCKNVYDLPSRQLISKTLRKSHISPVAHKCRRMRNVNDIVNDTGRYVAKRKLMV